MAAKSFEYFVILAGMRTGSNLLEEHLASMAGLKTYGELFNPNFFGKPKSESGFGLTIGERDQAPVTVVDRMKEQGEELPGFRLFYDHDLRVIDHVLADRSAAKIILTRRPIESYVSLKVARATGQWWLGDLSTARDAKVNFEVEEYREFLDTLEEFHTRIRRVLQTSGQTAFFVDYSELGHQDVIDGIGRFLDAKGPSNPGKVKAKVQNPQSLADRLINPEVAEEALSSFEDLNRVPSHEPTRGPGVRGFVASHSLPLLYMPIRGPGFDPVESWMKALDPKVKTGLSQKDIREWLKQQKGVRTFTVLRHPLARAYDAFCENFLGARREAFADIREVLATRYDVHFPDGAKEDAWTLQDQQQAFFMFLKFLVGNLGGQTSVRVDRSWASQEALFAPMARFLAVDRLVREDQAQQELDELTRTLGLTQALRYEAKPRVKAAIPLSSIRNTEIEQECAKAYKRDYAFFGFSVEGG